MPRRHQQSVRWVKKVSSQVIEWGAIAVLFSAPLWGLPTSFGSSAAKLSFILAGTVLLLGAAALKSWAKQEISLRIPWIFVGAALFIVASLISLTHATNPCFVLSSLLLLGLFLSFGLVIAQCGITQTSMKRILGALLATSSIVSVIAILQYAGILGDLMLDPVERAISTFGNRNYLGSFLGVMALPSLALLLLLRRTRAWVVAWPASALCFLGVVLVQQVGMVIALLAGITFVVVGIAVFGLGRYVRTHYKTLLAITLAAILGLGVGFTLWRINPHHEVRDSSGTIITNLWESNSGETREIDWGVAWEMFKANSWTGVGLGNYKVGFLEYKSLSLSGPSGARYVRPITRAAQAHNEYLQVLAELGIPGMAGIIVLISLAIGTSWIRCRSLATESQRLEFLLLTAGLVVVSAHAVVSFPFHLPITALLFVTILGLASSSYFGERAILRAHLVGTTARAVAIAGFLLLCLLGAVLGREFSAHVSYSRGVVEMGAGENAQAQDSFERSISTSVCSAEDKFLLATVALLRSNQALQIGDQAQAAPLLQIAWSNALLGQDEYPTEEGLLLLAGIAVMLDERSLAEDVLSRLLASRPKEVFETDARYLLAALHAQEGDFVIAKKALRDLIQDFPSHVQSYVLLGQLLLQEGATEEGNQTFAQGMQIVERELSRIENDLKTANSLTRDELMLDQQRLLFERQSLAALLGGQ